MRERSNSEQELKFVIRGVVAHNALADVYVTGNLQQCGFRTSNANTPN
jgi:hypothetical protein